MTSFRAVSFTNKISSSPAHSHFTSNHALALALALVAGSKTEPGLAQNRQNTAPPLSATLARLPMCSMSSGPCSINQHNRNELRTHTLCSKAHRNDSALGAGDCFDCCIHIFHSAHTLTATIEDVVTQHTEHTIASPRPCPGRCPPSPPSCPFLYPCLCPGLCPLL